MGGGGGPSDLDPSAAGSSAAGDRALVVGMARGDSAYLAAFYTRYAAEVYGLIRGMVPDEAASQDLLQETMWQVWRQASRYRASRSSVRTWLHLIARSRVLDWRRHELRHPRPVALDAAADLADPAASNVAAHAADHQDLARAWASLSPAERQVIHLTYYRGLSQSEAATTLGVPLGTVKGRVRSALARLRAGLGAGLAGEEGPV